MLYVSISKWYQFINYVIILSIITLLPLVIHPDLYYTYQIPKVFFLKIAVILFIISQISSYLYKEKLHITANYLDLFIFIKPVLLLLLFIFVEQYRYSLNNISILVSLLVLYILMKIYLLELEIQKRIQVIKWVDYAFIIVGLCESIFCFLQFFGLIAKSTEIVYKSLMIGTIGNANAVGGYLAATSPFIIGAIYLTKHKSIKWLSIFVFLFCFAVIILTKSRGAWIGLSVGLLILFYKQIKVFWNKLHSKKFLYIIITILFLLILYFFYQIYLMNVSSAAGRLFIWKVSSLMIKDHPVFGVGFGNYAVYYLNYQELFFQNPANFAYFDFAANIKQAHNEYLHIFAETGMLGLLIFILTIAAFFYYGIKILKRTENQFIKNIIKVVLASNTIILIHGLFDCPFYHLPGQLIFILNCGILSSFILRSDFDKHNFVWHYFVNVKKIIRKWPTKIIVILLFLVILIFSSQQFYCICKEYQGYKYWQKGINSTNDLKWDLAVQAYKISLSYMPDNGELHFHLAAAYVMKHQYKKSLPHFNKAMENFNDKNLYLSQGLAYQNLGYFNIAENKYKKVIGMYPNLLHPRYLLGEMYYNIHHFENAKKMFESIINIQPKITNKESQIIKKSASDYLKNIAM